MAEKDDFDRWGSSLQQAYDKLPSSFMGFDRNNVIDAGRLGVMEIGRFYRMFTGCPEGPSSNMDWFLISEPALAAAASGEVFVDRSGEFSAIRRRLQRFYPRDILLKKLALHRIQPVMAPVRSVQSAPLPETGRYGSRIACHGPFCGNGHFRPISSRRKAHALL